jgi:hypothetical protein
MDERENPRGRGVACGSGNSVKARHHTTEIGRDPGVEVYGPISIHSQRPVLRKKLERESRGSRVVVELSRQERSLFGGAGDPVVGPGLALESPAGLGVDGPLQQERGSAVDLDSIDEIPAGKSTESDAHTAPG